MNPFESVKELIHVILGWKVEYFDLFFMDARSCLDVALYEAFQIILNKLENHILDEFVLIIFGVEEVLP